MASKSWTPEEEAWLAERYPVLREGELCAEHAELFGSTPRTAHAIRSRARVLGLRKPDGWVRNPSTLWTGDRAEWFRSFVPGHTEPEIIAEHERLYGFPLTASQIGNGKHKLGVRSGTHGGRFEKGQEPRNKGKTWDEFMPPESQERSRQGQFRKGNLSGFALRRRKPIGYERISKGGYVEVKVSDGIQERPNCNYRKKHHIVWEQANGRPVPEDCNIVFADRDPLNLDPDNLVAVPRDLWGIISNAGWSYGDRASLEACMAVARFKRAVTAAELRPRVCKACGAEFVPDNARQVRCRACIDDGKKAGA